MTSLGQIRRRVNQIVSYAKLASSPIDCVNLAVVGYATGHTFDARGIVSRVGRWAYPTITTRPSTVGGMRVVLDPSDISHLVVFAEVIAERIYDLKGVPFVPDLVLDCGGHIGLFTMQAASYYPESKIMVFEPNPQNVEHIKQHAVLNNLKVNLVEAAVSNHGGESWFQAECSFGGMLQPSSEKSEGSYCVKVVDLPALIKELSPDKLLIKVDIEGEELNLFPSLIPELPKQCAILFESHDGEDGWHFIAEELKVAGFEVHQTRCRYPYADGFALRK